MITNATPPTEAELTQREDELRQHVTKLVGFLLLTSIVLTSIGVCLVLTAWPSQATLHLTGVITLAFGFSIGCCTAFAKMLFGKHMLWGTELISIEQHRSVLELATCSRMQHWSNYLEGIKNQGRTLSVNELSAFWKDFRIQYNMPFA
jgi:hypothetical protein